jgi:sigma-B regulation protein RsbU (phosphoserine phosphatase)
MEPEVFDSVQENLREKRQNIKRWLKTTPASKKHVRLGPADERAVRAHLDVLDTALEKTADKTLGICEVCQGFVGTELLEMDYTACVCIDHFSPEEIRNLEYELELSQLVQKGFLPQQVPEVPGLEFAAFSRPAQIVGGDYFDFFQFQSGAHGLAIADVAGHGMSASLLMTSVQTALRTLVPISQSPVDVVAELNRLFCHNIHFTTFVTLFLAALDPTTHTLTYSSAGHNPPLLFHKEATDGKQVTWLPPTGAAIGLIEESLFTAETLQIAPGDMLLLYTDGVTEAINVQEEEFGQERLGALIEQWATLSPRDLVRTVRYALQEFTAGRPLADDTTIVVCKISE